MSNTAQGLRVCPTRVDGSPVLFAHKVDLSRCQERQRQRYHKCFACAWNNSYVSQHGEPALTAADDAAPAPEKEETTAKVG